VGWVTLTPDCPAANPTGGDCAAGLLEADNDTAAAALVIAATDPDYTAAFLRAVRSEHGYRAWTADEQRAYVRVEAARATMSEGGSGSYLATNLSPSRQASIGITAGRAGVPQTCWAKRSSSRNGSVRINIIFTSWLARHAHESV
jgi:hypothetical protein